MMTVIEIQQQAIINDYVYAYQIGESDFAVIVAIMHKPISTRSEREKLFQSIAEECKTFTQKAIYVTADLDIYCDLKRGSVEISDIVALLQKRGYTPY